jgi:DNA-binding NtrC family response regulator
MKPEARSDCEPAGSMVFVVDDDDSMRESLRSLIRSVGLSVEAFDPYEHPHNKVSGLNVLEFPFREVSPNSLRTLRASAPSVPTIARLPPNTLIAALHHVRKGLDPLAIGG